MSLKHILTSAGNGVKAAGSVAKSVGAFAKNNASHILTATGFVLVTCAVVKGVLDGEKVKEDIQKTEIENGKELSKKEKFVVAGKRLWPVAAMTVGGLGCIACAHYIEVRECIRTAAELETLRHGYSELKNDYTDLTGKYFDLNSAVDETLSPDDSAKVHNNFLEKQIENTPYIQDDALPIGEGNEIFVDSITGQYFKTSKAWLYQALSKLNIKATKHWEGSVFTVNELLEEYGANQAGEWADRYGWDISDGPLEIIEFRSHKIDATHWIPAIEYSRRPKELYQRYD